MFVLFSGTQFRWSGTQAEGVRWSMNSLFIGECPEYCHDRGLCTVSGCQCAIGYSGTYCEEYVGKKPLQTWFNETFDDLSVVGTSGPNSNNWIRLNGKGHIRHVCGVNINNNTNNYFNGQALHFGADCGCGTVEAITRELNISQATTISYAFHVTTEDNCITTKDNITVALEWTYDEGISWWCLVTMYNQEHAQYFNLTLPSEMINISEKRNIGGIRFRWTQVERAAHNIYWAIDNIRLE
ncbi:unnamed protein product [Rotaria sp. Silwood1]|nr:unnamed protein product [Rotaria sp. Silwood1]CAF3387311.1 unnamed protein product [Rotaria sp. Silwood1]CAF3411774.1 unnamed protein product [Rotaria sp. Silwood1]CAF4597051.1 unnamed protein product [Rotaria sp. Silwood1]CAF4757770.1 unnamed protein product [Rotaria sp. Silwood1]